jgi:hypothetical protein
MNNDKNKQLNYAKNQFEIYKLRAMKNYAEATTGVCVLKNTYQGREVTEEEKARGEVIGWRPHTDQEKIQNSLEVMQRFIELMEEANDIIYNLTEPE